jgi:hypothetical protein
MAGTVTGMKVSVCAESNINGREEPGFRLGELGVSADLGFGAGDTVKVLLQLGLESAPPSRGAGARVLPCVGRFPALACQLDVTV